ncbi:MAG: M20/M25/M40 family metallo-hydrolase [Bacteroidales bacterium]|nr:M20/M25/M40 family metallo-hydrolase [Bacteroidales bacterium]
MIKKITFGLLLLLFTVKVFTQVYDPYIQEKVDLLSYDTLFSRLTDFENLGIKEPGTASLNNTGNWIISLYESFGYSDIVTDTFNYAGNDVYNIIVTKTGTLFPDTYIIVDGHYDTYNGPGVNDNGTGTAIVLETARILKDVETAYSVKFIHFTAEEEGLVGSYHYVENVALPQNMDIKLVFNIDEVGGIAGEVNNTITCERDEWAPPSNNAASAAYTNTLATLTEIYSALNTSISYAYGSDYVPFMLNGYVVTGLYEYNESPYPHSLYDSLSKLDPVYVFEVTKASVAASLYFSEAYDISTNTSKEEYIGEQFKLYPNPFNDFINLVNEGEEKFVFRLFNQYAQSIHISNLNPTMHSQIAVDVPSGIYLYRLSDTNGKLLKTGKLIKR